MPHAFNTLQEYGLGGSGSDRAFMDGSHERLMKSLDWNGVYK